MEIQEHVKLSEHCRFRVGGPADYFTTASSHEELSEALAFAKERELRHVVYGGGSNIFFADAGFRGLVVQLKGGNIVCDVPVARVTAAAGYELGALIRLAADKDLGGIEFLGNIPGSLGGAIVGNAGCYGRNIGEVLVRAKLLRVEEGEVLEVEPDFFEYGYRQSRLKRDPRFVVLEATLQLVPRLKQEIMAELHSELSERIRKHPHEAWCAGSFFMNPDRDQPAWKLIDEVGLKGLRSGGAMISEQHANFLINDKEATSDDILKLVEKVQDAVQRQFGIMLHAEVRYVSPVGFVNL